MDQAAAHAAARAIADRHQADMFLYCGPIDRNGYASVTDCCCAVAKPRENAYLILMTYGGDADAAYRIVRALRHYYAKLTVLVPVACKSAGTLLIVGASELVLSDKSELGPLDVQVVKPDEIAELGSGLDVLTSLGFLQQHALEHFNDFLMRMKFDMGISAKTAAEIATKLTVGLFQPLYSQIDPARLGELQRATAIALAYGERLRKDYEGNIRSESLRHLVMGYPSHGFVIDRREARTLFKNVRASDDDEAGLGEFIFSNFGGCMTGRMPVVLDVVQTLKPEEQCNESQEVQRGDAAGGGDAAGDERGLSEIG